MGRWRIKKDLGAEIRRGEIEQAVPHQQFQFWVEGENLPQLGNRLGGSAATAEIPGFLDRTVEQLVGPVGPPIELARGEFDRRTGQRREQRIAGGVVETI